MSDRFVTDDLKGWSFQDEKGNPLDPLNQPPEPPAAPSEGPPTPAEELASVKHTSPADMLRRSIERGAFTDAPVSDQANRYSMGAPFSFTGLFLGSGPLPAQGVMLDPAEANARYAPKDAEFFDKPISEGLAQVVAKQRLQKLQDDYNLSRYENAHSWPANFGMNVVGSMLDPINLGAMFVGGPELGVAESLGGGVVARLAGRAVSGAIGGVIGQAPIVAARAGLDDNYTLREAFFDLAMGAAGGAVIQGGIEGGLREGWRAALGRTGSAVNTATKIGVSQIIEGKPVDVTPIIYPPASDLAIREIQDAAKAKYGYYLHDDVAEQAARIGGNDVDFAISEAMKLQPRSTLAQVAEEQKTLNETGWAPGMSNEEFLTAKEQVNAAATAKPSPSGPEPAALGSAGAPTEPAAPATPGRGVEPQILDQQFLRNKFTGKDGSVDGVAMGDFIREEAKNALSRGDKVTFWAENKPRNIVKVDALGLKDENGNPWGTLPLLMQKPGENDRIEITPKESVAGEVKASPNAKRLAPEEVDRIIALPEIQADIKTPRQIDRTHDVPYLAGSNNEGGITYIDKRVPTELGLEGLHDKSVVIDPAGPLNVHEQVEHALMTKGRMPYEEAHRVALVEEQKAVEALGAKWTSYQDAMKKLVGTTEHENAKTPPPDLYLKPYDHTPLHGELEGKETAPVATEVPFAGDPEVAAAQEALASAQARAQAYTQAAQCLTEAGI